MRYWMAVACAEHVARGRAGGFMQVNHGKLGPLRRMQPGDGIVYYSPSQRMGGKDGYQSFTAVGHIRPGEPYQGVMSGDFKPYRRDVDWKDAEPKAIRQLLEWLDFAQGPNWGYALRLGVIEISAADFEFIEHVMTRADSVMQQLRSEIDKGWDSPLSLCSVEDIIDPAGARRGA